MCVCSCFLPLRVVSGLFGSLAIGGQSTSASDAIRLSFPLTPVSAAVIFAEEFKIEHRQQLHLHNAPRQTSKPKPETSAQTAAQPALSVIEILDLIAGHLTVKSDSELPAQERKDAWLASGSPARGEASIASWREQRIDPIPTLLPALLQVTQRSAAAPLLQPLLQQRFNLSRNCVWRIHARCCCLRLVLRTR